MRSVGLLPLNLCFTCGFKTNVVNGYNFPVRHFFVIKRPLDYGSQHGFAERRC
jgi:hypothetical protein